MKRFTEQRHVLGSQADIVLVSKDTPSAAELFTEIWQSIEQFEARFSRFKTDSELSKFNAQAGSWAVISTEYMQLLLTCKQYAKITDGLFNPFVLPALQLAGYKGSWPAVQILDPQLDYSDRHITTMDHLQIASGKAKIPAHAALDFGGIGKGYALDILGELLAKRGCTSYIISLGGDVLCAGLDESGRPWNIGIKDVHDEKLSVGTITNQTGERCAIASSGILKRSGKGWHHLIDPRTGSSADTNVLMATVIATSGTAADIFAKSCVLDSTFTPSKDSTSEAILATFLQLKDGSRQLTQKAHFITEQC